MATKNATVSRMGQGGDDTAMTFKWVLTGTDDGAPLEFLPWADRSVQVGSSGDNFNGGTVLLEGSNDGVTWTTLRDPTHTALTFTAAGLRQVLESTAYIRPRASVAVTSVQVILAVRRASSIRT
jgi:hypothetical protein